MPQMANITIKKNDGTTDQVYNQVTASGGDKAPAVWKANNPTLAPLFRPELRVQGEWNGPRTARRVNAVYVYPFTAVGGDGRVQITDKMIARVEIVLPQGVTQADGDESAAQFCHLMAAVLIKDTFKSGYAPV